MNKKLNFILLSILILSVVLIVLSSSLHFFSGGKVPYDYGITIDAGSSKTKLFLYDWNSIKVNQTGFVKESDTKKLPIDIHNQGDNLSHLTKMLVKALNEITNGIDYTRKNFEIPIYLGATAGMRLLKAVNAADSENILKTIKNSFVQYTKSQEKSLKVQEVEIITGEKEGLYCWIATNYLMGYVPPEDRPVKGTIGILDMGGASAQIAFETSCKADDKCLVDNQKTSLVANEKTRLFGSDYDIYTYSNLCFGNDDARRRYQYLLILKSDFKQQVDDPCTHLNQLDRIITKAEILKDICTSNDKNKADLTHESYTFKAKPDVQKCNQYTKELFNSELINKFTTNEEINFKIMKEHPPEDVTFYALSTYYYTTSRLVKKDVINFQDEDDFYNKIASYCAQKWEDIVKGQSDQEIKYLHNYCFAANYVFNYLKHVYKFEGKHFNKITFREKLNGHDLGWSLGYMLQATNSIPDGGPEDPVLNKTQFISLSTLGFILFLAVLLFFLKFKLFQKGSSPE